MRASKLTSSNLPDSCCNSVTRPLTSSVTRHHACVETGWQLGALGPTAVASRGWTAPRCHDAPENASYRLRGNVSWFLMNSAEQFDDPVTELILCQAHSDCDRHLSLAFSSY